MTVKVNLSGISEIDFPTGVSSATVAADVATINLSGGGSGFNGVNSQSGTSYTFVNSDAGKLVTFSNSSAIAATLPQAGSGGNFASTWTIWVENRGTGTLTITPTTSTIDGATSLALTQNQGCTLFSDGTNYFTERGVGGSSGNTTTSVTAFVPATPPDAPPANPTTWDDEFNASTLNPKWTRQQTGAITDSYNLNRLLLTNINANGQLMLSQSKPAAPCEFTAAFTLDIDNSTSGGNNPAVGICFGDGTKVQAFMFGFFSPNWQFQVFNFSSFATFSSAPNVASTTWGPTTENQGKIYLRIKDDGTNIICSASVTGFGFKQIFSFSRTSWLSSPTTVGIYFVGATGAVGDFSCPWFRRTDGGYIPLTPSGAVGGSALTNPVFVQANAATTGGSTASSVACAYQFDNTAGNFLVCAVRNFKQSGTAGVTVTDSLGNTWVQAPNNYTDTNEDAAGCDISLWYVTNCKGGANTVTVTANTASTFPRSCIAEYSGIVSVSPYDTDAHATASSASFNSGNITTTASDLLIAFIQQGSSATYTINGWNQRATPDGNLVLFDQFAGSAGNKSFKGSLSSSVAWAATLYAFKVNTSVLGVALSPDSYPISVNAANDEFENATLNSKWTVVNNTGNTNNINTTVRGSLYVSLNASATPAPIYTISQAFSPGSSDLAVTVKFGMFPSANFHAVSMFLADTNTAGTNCVQCFWGWDASQVRAGMHKKVAGVQTNDIAVSPTFTTGLFGNIYLHLQRKSGVWTYWYSTNGMAWSPMTITGFPTFTISFLNLEIASYSTSAAAAIGAVDFIRVNDFFL